MSLIPSLQPSKRLLVYNLVREAGIDVSAWSDYSRPQLPQTNPKFCYEWSFVGAECVVVCLWFGDMKPDGDTIFQVLNYAVIPSHRTNLSAVQKVRRLNMDGAFRTARANSLPVRVIIVDGPDDGTGTRSVKRRALDPEPWHVASYDERTGECRLQRGRRVDASNDTNEDDTFNDLTGLDLSLLGRDEAKRLQQTVSGVKRDPAVRRAVINRSKGVCERPGCGERRDYVGFLDVHHILGAEKSDRAWTCVALCPNCHREAHFCPKRESLNGELLNFARKFQPRKSA
jgi:hypothetical protein